VDSPRRGLIFGLAAYGLWGSFPLYFPLLEPASSLEILACRVVFSVVVVALLLRGLGRLGAARRLDRTALTRLALAGGLIAVNWGVYIWAVNHRHVVEASLGYFVNPLVTVGLGVVVLHERLRRVQWLALAVGACAVLVLTADSGRPPWIALVLAASFGSYSLLKKRVGVGAAEGLLVESSVLAVPALVVLAVLAGQGTLTLGHRGAAHDALLASAGLVTAVPLLFFAGAASRLPLSTLGLLQYLTPVLQLAVGVGVRHEPLPPARLAGFALVWVALLVLTIDALRHRADARAPQVVHEPVTGDLVSATR